MAAITGPFQSYSFLAGANVLTTTSQFRVVALGTTSGSPGTVVIATTTSQLVIGINQTYFPTSTSSGVCQVAVSGFSKAICATSVTAGDYLIASTAGAVTTFAPGTVLTTTTLYHGVGYALDNGSTNSAIGIFIRPQFVPFT